MSRCSRLVQYVHMYSYEPRASSNVLKVLGGTESSRVSRAALPGHPRSSWSSSRLVRSEQRLRILHEVDAITPAAAAPADPHGRMALDQISQR